MYMAKVYKVMLIVLVILNLMVLSTLVGMQNREAVITHEIEEHVRVSYVVENREVDYRKILDSNVSIYNSTIRCSGSGTHIKSNGKSYILTCAHLLEDEYDTIWMELDRTQIPLTLIKQSKMYDLALFELNEEITLAHMEISEISPEPSDEVLVIGNPEGQIDMNGIVSKREGDYYIITNKVFFGNSGGALVYNGKLAGVISELHVAHQYNRISIQVVYGIAVNLETIKSFLEDDYYEEEYNYDYLHFEMQE